MSVMLEANDASVVVDEDVDEPELWEEENGNPDLSSLTDCEHLPCFAHSLQLVVRDGLSALGVARPLLAKCCKLASLLHQSALFRSLSWCLFFRLKSLSLSLSLPPKSWFLSWFLFQSPC